MPENKIDFGIYSTASWTVTSDGTRERTECVNPQLDAWIDAKTRFKKIYKRKYNWGDFVYIIDKLGDSLSIFFGINCSPMNYTPPLLAYINKYFPEYYGWCLEDDNPILYKQFIQLDNYYKDKCKHYDINKVKQLEVLTLDNIKTFMETTRLVWIWFLEKKLGSNLKDEILHEFKETYT